MESNVKRLILCVDDSKDQLVLIKRWLEGGGYEVLTAGSAIDALQVLTKSTPDLILMDVIMPETDGYKLCAKLQTERALAVIPVVFLTALYTRQEKAKALSAGGVDFLVKPVRQERLLETVKRNLAASLQWKDYGTKKSPVADLRGFLSYLQAALNLSPEVVKRLSVISAEDLYKVAKDVGLPEEQLAQHLAKFLDLPYLAEINPTDVELGVLPTSFCKARLVVPYLEGGIEGGEKSFVVSNPLAWKLIDDLTSLFGLVKKPKLLVTQPRSFREIFGDAPGNLTLLNIPVDSALAGRHKAEPASMSDIEEKLAGMFKAEEQTLIINDDSEEAAPIILLVNKLIDDAVTAGASDIHIEPWEREVVVRYRIDGDLRLMQKLQPQKMNLPMVARIKIMSNLSITERRLPQDGRIVYKDGIDLRVSTVPTNYGEKVVMRLLDKKKSAQPLDTLGFSARNLQQYRDKIQTPYGMILHVGPTGSGKSMTLFSALKEIQTPEINIQTIEDPIEYTLPGISQVQVNQAVGLNFARGLRSFLRQDPDVILVGEIRDRETADVAVEASLTGHLVLSTLHTNDSAATVTRLIEMGVEPYLVSSSIVMICAQRLLRRLCLKCKISRLASNDEKYLAGVPADKELTLYFAGKCDACGGTGYKGRIGVHELLVMNDGLRTAMGEHGMTSDALKQLAVEKGSMTTLYWDGVDKARAGITSIQEVVAQIRRDDFESKPKWM